MKRNTITVVLLVIVLLGSFLLGRSTKSRVIEHIDNVVDTVIRVDTIIDRVLVPEKVYITRVDTVVMRIDSIVTDTEYIYVTVPISRKEYKTDEYHAIVEGYKPSLYYIETYNRTKEVTKVKYISKKWGVGLQAGVGYSFNKGVYPYVGVGVQYNLISW